jgi:23S rRNA (cytidine1920-2'-O)/16S rRNA (cytidine1409-2'-O)-methyltransferase
VLVLCKPQFEVGRGRVGKGGVVREVQLQIEAVAGVASAAQEHGMRKLDECLSPITGADGNQEFFLLLAGPER